MAESEAHPITVAIERRIDPARTAEATAWMQAGTDLATTFEGFLGSGWVRAGEKSDLWFMLYRFRDIPTLEAWEDSGERTWWLESGRGFAKEGRVERRTGIEGWFDAPLATHIETRMPGAEDAERADEDASAGTGEHAPAGTDADAPAGTDADAPGGTGEDASTEAAGDAPREATPESALAPLPATGPIRRPIPAAPPRWKQAVTIWLGFFPTNLLALWLLGFIPGFAELPLVVRVLSTTILLTPVMTYVVLPWVTRRLRPWLQKRP
ncbi:antibiotic biosynthesis monooxygenase [Microbacterium sp. DT81.1]|uniref:antibiotic biosynthesis monooxygenase n=1 Tax=Microbacterium sp. DT81.1 TaxID=3393413 RepID=UPI003CF4903E